MGPASIPTAKRQGEFPLLRVLSKIPSLHFTHCLSFSYLPIDKGLALIGVWRYCLQLALIGQLRLQLALIGMWHIHSFALGLDWAVALVLGHDLFAFLLLYIYSAITKHKKYH